VSPDFDHITALISATKELNTNIKAVTLRQLQEKCMRQEIPKSGTKPKLLAKLQTHEKHQADKQKTDNDNLASPIIVQLETPIIEPIDPGSPKAFDFPKNHKLT
jgi:hypothetical protein